MRVILDCDPGNGIPAADIDDALAIGLALRSPEIELEAITVVAGNVPVEYGLRAALEVLDAAGARDVPVHRGAGGPLVQDPTGWRTLLDERRDGIASQEIWRDVHQRHNTTVEVASMPAAQALVDYVNRSPGEITVVGVGPMTNIATAMLLDPGWAGKVSQLVIMAGAFDLPNVLQELNAAYDPEASHIVFNSVAPLLIIPLDVTMLTYMRLQDLDRLEAAATPLATYLARTVRPWVTWLAQEFGRDGCPLHDPLAVASLLDPDVITTRTASVDMELRGTLTRGRTVAWDSAEPHLLVSGVQLPQSRPVSIANGVDNDRFMPLLLDRLSS